MKMPATSAWKCLVARFATLRSYLLSRERLACIRQYLPYKKKVSCIRLGVLMVQLRNVKLSSAALCLALLAVMVEDGTQEVES